MRRGSCAGIAFLLLLSLCGCNIAKPTGQQASDPTTPDTTNETTQTAATQATQTATEGASEPAAPTHSPLYLADHTQEQIIAYFEEIALDMEYTDGTGNSTLIQKWNAPLRYRITGDPTDTDLAVLNGLFAQLNAVPGFPGIYPVEDGALSNLNIGFMNPTDFKLAFSGFLQGEDAYGATQFWYYTATNEIHTANIGYRTDIDQATRNSILLEEIVNMLGLSDTVLRQDSIVYQYSNTNTALSDVDWVILKLLYDPAIQCGMNADRCKEIIQTLYY